MLSFILVFLLTAIHFHCIFDCFKCFSVCYRVNVFLPRWMECNAVSRWEFCLLVCPSVCLSVKRVICDKTEERSVQIFTPYEREFSLFFWEEEWLLGATPSTWNFGSTGSCWSEIADFQPTFARSASAVTPSERSSKVPKSSKSSTNTNRKSTTQFPTSPKWSSCVVPEPPKKGSKTQSVQNLNSKLR